MKKYFSIFIILFLFTKLFAIELLETDKMYLWNWYSYWMSKGKTHEEAHKLLDEDAKYELTEVMLKNVIQKAKNNHWEAQDVESLKIQGAAILGDSSPLNGIESMKDSIKWIEENSPERKKILGKAYNYLSTMYGELQKFNKMEATLSKAILNNDDIEFRIKRAAARFTIGDIKGSDEDFAVLEKRCPDNPRYLKYKAHFEKLKKEQEAEE